MRRRPRSRSAVRPGDTFYAQWFERIARIAIEHRLPWIYNTPQYVDAGGFMSYGPDVNDNFHRAASFVDRILKGAKAGDLPFEHPSTYRLSLNLKTAKAIGADVPQSFVQRADRVIH
ncbi:MAG TPA: ABC transporter substrate binding protein [Casimicrobiaceae bacterium]|nr:ABC transporter substrate binding protein [Casimicrobiaceae bacterium]